MQLLHMQGISTVEWDHKDSNFDNILTKKKTPI